MSKKVFRRVYAIVVLFALVSGGAACGFEQTFFQKGGKVGMAEVELKTAVEPVRYVALGDSTGVGVGARNGGYVARLFQRIERVRPASRLTNLCVSGATTADVLRSQVAGVGAARPTLVTLGIGINDVSRDISPDQFARNYEEIVKRIRQQTDAPIVVANIPDISFAPRVPVFLRDEARRRINSLNRHINEITARHKLLLVDSYQSSHEVVPTHPEFFSADGFHPSDEGYEFWAVKMWPTVKEAIGEE